MCAPRSSTSTSSGGGGEPSGGGGGAVYSDEGTLTITGSTFTGNTADSDGVIAVNHVNRGDGGAIFHGRGTLNLTSYGGPPVLRLSLGRCRSKC